MESGPRGLQAMNLDLEGSRPAPGQLCKGGHKENDRGLDSVCIVAIWTWRPPGQLSAIV